MTCWDVTHQGLVYNGVDIIYQVRQFRNVSLLINPLNPKSDQHQISPRNFNAL